MNTIVNKLKPLSLLLAASLMTSPVWADTASEAQAETGAAKAVKESHSFTDHLDREEFLGGTFSTWVEFASDYVFRGESETNDGKIPSLKAAITWSHPSGVYLGYYAANNLFPATRTETNQGNNSKINAIYGPYIGYSTKDIAGTGINMNSMLFQYIYPGDSDSNYLEMFNYIDKQFGDVNIKLEYSPTITDWFGVKDLQSHNIAIHPSISLPNGFTLSGGVGYQFFTNDSSALDYNGDGDVDLNWAHWNLGLSRNVFGFNVDVRYHDTNIRVGENDFYGFTSNNQIVDERWMFAVSKSF